jgi:hypothetical protein
MEAGYKGRQKAKGEGQKAKNLDVAVWAKPLWCLGTSINE